MEDLNNMAMLWNAILLVWIAAPAIVAYRKGYEWGWWLLTGGVIGVFVLAFFPRLGPNHPDAVRWRATARRAGVATLMIHILVLIGFVYVAIARR